MKREFIGTVADVQVDDEVMGRDGKWHKITDLLPPFMPKLMYSVHLENGYVECTGDHQWNVFLAGNSLGNFDTSNMLVLFESFEKGDLCVGVADGPALLGVERIEPKMSCCLVVDSEDHQFEILTHQGGDGK
jgi:hypothetical protein